MKLTIAHSPDADDAFMFYALTHDKIDTGGLKFQHTLQDIQQCNEDALKGKFDVTAISFAAYPSLANRYILLNCGASMGEKNYGPMLVAKKLINLTTLAQKTIAIPGKMTTAALLLKLFAPSADKLKVMPFNQIIGAVVQGEADVGLVIHEGQLTYKDSGLAKLLDFGEWWWGHEKLPLALGGNVILKKIDKKIQRQFDTLLRTSIVYALQHRQEALDYALRFAKNLERDKADQFVGMYVNERSLDYGDDGRKSISRLLSNAPVEFVS